MSSSSNLPSGPEGLPPRAPTPGQDSIKSRTRKGKKNEMMNLGEGEKENQESQNIEEENDTSKQDEIMQPPSGVTNDVRVDGNQQENLSAAENGNGCITGLGQ
ncbi:uncharacterized protein MELLADRAFT_101308 [Melampsora larici-populina 98AG31]|uniref:Uncharacterized protein n=1 Tax=Melampsora larici-populina (strain 98AG31 / pathotype 3-4-7) TaxID=747676 RepID=F4R4B1_MELLP|nr:uncharacterized protein MELLADRAFT_101308 [Melampsora larici-populina 98AG31]EGG13032.1 hypothetical protein MELLADRAFT_101308 [Melampsora larici-populina 98AG31]